MNRLLSLGAPSVLLSLCLGGCTMTMTGRKQVTLIRDAKMDAMGLAAFQDLKRRTRVNQDPATNDYVRCVAASILEVIPAEGGPKDGRWEVLVFDDPTPNAFALPGGKIGVHTGMLNVASTPGRLAAVLGHEVAHVLLRHGNERMSHAILAESVVAAASIAASAKAPRYGDLIAGGLGIGAVFGVLLPFSRKHENEADQVGQLFMARAGFYPAEAVVLWQAMAELEQGAPAQWQSTHPSDATRVARLEAALPHTMREFEWARAAGKNPACAPPQADRSGER